jgi:hypothetical protein
MPVPYVLLQSLDVERAERSITLPWVDEVFRGQLAFKCKLFRYKGEGPGHLKVLAQNLIIPRR